MMSVRYENMKLIIIKKILLNLTNFMYYVFEGMYTNDINHTLFTFKIAYSFVE